MNLIEDSKNDLLNFIDNLNITDGKYGNYDDILNLLNNTDDALFTKIIEEIKNGKLSFNDFTNVFGNTDLIKTTIEKQNLLYKKYQLYFYYNLEKMLALENININNIISEEELNAVYSTMENIQNNNSIGIRDKTDYTNTNSFIPTVIDKENILYSILNDENKSDPLVSLYRTKLLNEALSENGGELTDSLLLSMNDYIVPIDYEDIMLNDFDIEFMKKNKLSSDDVKKLKSLSAYFTKIQYTLSKTQKEETDDE